MADSLREQLLALGLAKEEQKKKPPRKRRKPDNTRGRPRRGAEKSESELSLDKAYALRRLEEKKQADRARKRKQAEDRQRRLINNEIRKIVKQHRLNKDSAEIGRNFMFRGRIRKVYVTAKQQSALGDGTMSVVYLSGGYHLLAAEHAEAVRLISPQHLVDLGGAQETEEEHPVPDDLTW